MEIDPLRPPARFIEAVLMFVVAPTVLAMFMQGWMVFPAIWTLAAVCLVVLMRDPTFDRAQLWNASGLRRGLGIIVICFAVGAPVLGAGLLAYDPDRLFELPRRDVRLWGVIMVGYPVLSVYAQELAFRTFFFHRYAPLFRDTARGRWVLIIASAAAFGYAHVIMRNAVAVAFATVGGLLFAYTYSRTRSLLACCIEHALYGCYLFTIGWGWYFYGGSIGR